MINGAFIGSFALISINFQWNLKHYFKTLDLTLVGDSVGNIPKIPYTRISKSIPLHFLLISRYRNSNLWVAM